MEKVLPVKNYLENKCQNSISFAKNKIDGAKKTIDYAKKFVRVSYKKTSKSLNKKFEVKPEEQLAQQPVSELEKMLALSLEKVK